MCSCALGPKTGCLANADQCHGRPRFTASGPPSTEVCVSPRGENGRSKGERMKAAPWEGSKREVMRWEFGVSQSEG